MGRLSAAAPSMGKGWPAASPRSTVDRHFVSDSVQSLPPVRVCTPPARGEGAILRGNYTSSSSEVSLERTPRDFAAYGSGRYALPRPLPHWHSAPAEDPGHLRATGSDAQHAQVLLGWQCCVSHVPVVLCQVQFRTQLSRCRHLTLIAQSDQWSIMLQGGHSRSGLADFQTPQLTPRSSCPSASTAAASCPQCPDSEARLAAARDAVVDLMQVGSSPLPTAALSCCVVATEVAFSLSSLFPCSRCSSTATMLSWSHQRMSFSINFHSALQRMSFICLSFIDFCVCCSG